jgi:hypothetical protein
MARSCRWAAAGRARTRRAKSKAHFLGSTGRDLPLRYRFTNSLVRSRAGHFTKDRVFQFFQ